MARLESIDLQIRINSALTVQSDKNGFFRDFCEQVFLTARAHNNWLERVFAECGSNQERINSLLSDSSPVSLIILSTLVHVKSVYRQKNAFVSMRRRLNAEKLQLQYFNENDPRLLKGALCESNVAVIQAPAKDAYPDEDDGLSLALAYRTRALILLTMGEGELALNDLKLSVKHGFKSQDDAEYYLKLTDAYVCMGEWQRAAVSLKLGEHLASKNPSQKSIFANSIETCRQNLMEKHSTEQPLLNAIKKRFSIAWQPQLKEGPNPVLESTSKLVQLANTRDKGRHIVASGEIQTGDILLHEKPVAACLLPTYFSTNCHHCFIRFIGPPTPCPRCAGVAFCSLQCMEEACKTYHRYECTYMNLYIGSGMSILCYIALRIFTQSDDVLDALKLTENLYKDLCSHPESRLPEDHLQRGLMAIFLARCLKCSNYLEGAEGNLDDGKEAGMSPTSLNDLELKIATALMGLLQVLQYNAHEIYEKLYKMNTRDEIEHPFEASKIVYIGAGLYKSAAYFNHECWPSVARHFVGRDLILTALRPHHSNEMVAENYGPIFTKHTKQERSNKLHGRYLFECECRCCTENWPLLNRIPNEIHFRCPTINCTSILSALTYPLKRHQVSCSGCRQSVSLKDQIEELIHIEEQYTEGAKAMQNKQVTLAIQVLQDAIDSFFKIAVLPHRSTNMAQEALISCYATLQVDFK